MHLIDMVILMCDVQIQCQSFPREDGKGGEVVSHCCSGHQDLSSLLRRQLTKHLMALSHAPGVPLVLCE